MREYLCSDCKSFCDVTSQTYSGLGRYGDTEHETVSFSDCCGAESELAFDFCEICADESDEYSAGEWIESRDQTLCDDCLYKIELDEIENETADGISKEG